MSATACICLNMERRLTQIEESVTRYLPQLDSADREKPPLTQATKPLVVS
jgi:hypothetical protein